MTRARVNSALIRRINTARLFHVIRQNPGISQQVLSRRSGIDPATISIIITNLETAGIVRRSGDAPTGRAGRPTVALTIDARAGFLAGIGIEPDTIRITLATIDGVACAELSVAGSTDPVVAVGAAHDGVLAALRCANADRGTLLGIGIAMPGLVSLEGSVVFAPNFGWRDIDVAAMLAARIDCPVRLENDVKAATIAEHLFGASRDITDFVHVTGRSGIGGGLYMMGEVYRGPHGLAGELGHMKIVPGGRICGCGAQGCLEAYVSERAILAELAANGCTMTNADAIIAAYAANETIVQRVMSEAGFYLGFGLANLINIISPRRIVLGGSLARFAPCLLPSAMASLRDNALTAIMRDVELVVSVLGDNAAPLGGVALALQHFLDDPPVSLARGGDRSAEQQRRV